MDIYTVAKFGTDWSIFTDARVLTKSNMANFLFQGQITWTVLVRLVPLQNSSEILWSYTVIILGHAIGANLSPMAHENMTCGPKWPIKILNGAKFYPDCVEIKNGIIQFSIHGCREKLLGYTRTVLSKLD